jgi:8-oxo-dGTP pyrophosphatase MutT (NUDIX family)
MKPKKYRRGIFIVVYVIVKNKIRYLILKRKLHWKGWEFPKGGIELQKSKIFGGSPKRGQAKGSMMFYETKKMAARREVKEETGLKILRMKKFKISGKYEYDKKYPDRKNFIGQSYGAVFAVEARKGKVRLDEREHSDYKWLGFSDAVKKLKWKNQKKSLKIVDSWLKNGD